MARANFVREDVDVRRQSLIEAAAACLASEGPKGTTVRAICRRAGVSAGLLTHYFDGISDLVVATYRHVGSKVAAAVAEAVAASGDEPRARLDAYVTASLKPPVLDPGLLATWLAFWSMIKSDPAIARVHDEVYAEFRGGLEDLLRAYWGSEANEQSVRLGAVAINALVDGLWLELCLNDSGPFTPGEAQAMALAMLDCLLEAGPLGQRSAT